MEFNRNKDIDIFDILVSAKIAFPVNRTLVIGNSCVDLENLKNKIVRMLHCS